MDTAMRDLDQLEEKTESESPARKAAMLAMAGLATVALVFAMGVVLGRGGSTEEPAVEDPLAALDRAAAAARAAQPEGTDSLDAEVRPDAMTFHDTLTAVDERPEVEAALAAAAAEEAHLDPIQGGAIVLPTSTIPIDDSAPAPITARALPPAGTIAEAPVRSTVPVARGANAPAGHDGEYTIQVISYTTREAAEVFADALRQRGHEAFVMRAELPGRTTPYYRVRVGPFPTQGAAERYRSTFEQEERMNSIVVHKQREQ